MLSKWKIGEKIHSEEKLDTISQVEKGERTVYIQCNVRFTDGSVQTIHDNVGRFRESAKSGPKVFV